MRSEHILSGADVFSVESFRLAARAVRKETFQFSFHYPLEAVPEAGPKHSLHYYLYSDRLAWEAMRMDASGIPRTWYRQTGATYWPAYIAWYGLVNLGHYLRRSDPCYIDIFLRQIDWLEANAVFRPDGAVVWPMQFDYFVGNHRLKAPWVSAHAQGFAISALVRGWRITRRPRLLELLVCSAKIFTLTVPNGGFRITMDEHVLYTEVPGSPAPGILDGFMISLLGLYDLLTETGDSEVANLFDEGISGLRNTLPYWNYRDKWSWYHNREYLCPTAYHCLHHLLLKVLARLTGENAFSECSVRWDPRRLSALDRAEIYLGFLFTKNFCRLKYRTWNQTAESLQLSTQAIPRAQNRRAAALKRRWLDMRDRAPVFVVGSARSGNTLLYRLLLSSGNFPKYHAEPVVFDLLTPQFGPFKHRRNRERMMKYWLRSTQFRVSELDAQRISARVLNEVTSAGEFLSTIMEEVARNQGCRRWVVWGPDNLLHMRAIKREIPLALFIHVIRDGRDVAYALQTKGFIRPFPWDRHHRLLVSALHWKWKVRQGLRVAPELGKDYLEVRFERLVMNPQQTLEEIGDFIGVPLDYEIIRKFQSAPNTSFPAEVESGSFAPVGRWKKYLSVQDVQQLESLIGDELLALGYSLCSRTTVRPSLRLRYLRNVYPAFYSFKEWARLNTPLGRLVNTGRLLLQD